MKLYRYLSEDELKKLLANDLDNIGSFYDDKEQYERVNTHNYKKGVKYLHFYFDKKEISRIEYLNFKRNSVYYYCEFNIPFYVIFRYIGIGRYDGRGYQNPLDSVYEVAMPANKMKRKYLINYEKNKNSEPLDLGPIIKFDKRLYMDDVIIDKTEEDSSQERM